MRIIPIQILHRNRRMVGRRSTRRELCLDV
jgi:hypothetical protein